MIEVQLPTSQNIGFELKETDGRLIFRWKEQYLESGSHFLRLNLPKDTHGKYLLGLVADSNEIDHIILIK